MNQIFLSHSSAQTNIADRLRSALVTAGIAVVADTARRTSEVARVVQHHIDSSVLVLVIGSRGHVDPRAAFDVGVARRLRRPVCLLACDNRTREWLLESVEHGAWVDLVFESIEAAVETLPPLVQHPEELVGAFVLADARRDGAHLLSRARDLVDIGEWELAHSLFVEGAAKFHEAATLAKNGGLPKTLETYYGSERDRALGCAEELRRLSEPATVG